MEKSAADVSKAKLAADLKAVIADAEELLRITAGQAEDKVAELRDRIESGLRDARASLDGMQDVVVDGARKAGRVADDYVHENPWNSVGIAAGVGLLIGILIGRR